ncbi:hypothetical protein QBC43DRAFT_315417 [Cladorrhinum sp. PSN259]|nr:hypothetical protein QBC43DRAFT_315417 [Cladorrhinum sp. PSN259]
MSVNVFRFFRPAGEKEKQSEKRRAQVRRAQQTYRLRKDEYTRSLEKEVTRLRSVESELVRENQRLQDTINAQQRLIAKKGSWGDLWDCLSSDDDVFGGEVGISPPLSDQSQLPPLSESTLDSQWPRASPSHQGQSRRPELAPLAFQSHPTPSAFIPPSETVKRQDCQPNHPSDMVTTGVEFVLALESPCLSHIHGDPSAPQQATGHALTTSSYVLAFSPPSPLPSSPESNKESIAKGLESAPWTILDRLLALSTSFALEDEVTPAQAWARIREQVEKGGIKTRVGWCNELVARLAGLVKCHGFGAVLKVDVFEQVLREVMAEVRGVAAFG